MARGVVWLEEWCGSRSGVARGVVCERCGVARGVVLLQEWWGSRSGVREVWSGQRCGVASGAVVTRGAVWCGGMSGRGWPVHSLDRRMLLFLSFELVGEDFFLFFRWRWSDWPMGSFLSVFRYLARVTTFR